MECIIFDALKKLEIKIRIIHELLPAELPTVNNATSSNNCREPRRNH